MDEDQGSESSPMAATASNKLIPTKNQSSDSSSVLFFLFCFLIRPKKL